MASATADYTKHFWGQKHHGYHVLYENLKHEEESVQDLIQFVKERAGYEEECNKFLNKCVTKANGLTVPGSMFSSAWLITKNTMELLLGIEASFYFSLQHLLKDIFKYHDDLVRSRKKMKEQDFVDAVNLMQTTTTCLQKSKETYVQRVNEFERLKKENATSKEIAKAENKLNKSCEEYKSYVEKYGRVRDDFEEKMIKATRLFQEHDQAFLLQMKTFMAGFARALDESTCAASQVCAQYRDCVDKIDVNEILVNFVEAKGTGKDRPEFAVFEEIDISKDINVSNFVSASSSSNSPTVMHSLCAGEVHPSTGQNLFSLDANSLDIWNNENSSTRVQPSPVASDSSSSTAANAGVGALPFSASLGRQKLSLWLPGKRKKYASQSSLSTELSHQEFNHNQPDSLGFLKKYRSKHKKSNTDLTVSYADGPTTEDSKSTASSKSEDKPFVTTNGSMNILDLSTALPPPPPNVPPPEDDDEDDGDDEGTGGDNNFSHSHWNDDDDVQQAAKLRHMSIKPLNESKGNITASVDELRDAVGNIVINSTTFSRSSTFDGDPWSSSRRLTPFSTSIERTVRPLRAALTGDDYLRGKQLDSYNASLPFSVSMSGSSIVRARPHSSSTPTPGTSSLALQMCGYSGSHIASKKDSPPNEYTFSRGESMLSWERSSTSEIPFTVSTSNLLSASAAIAENRIPIAMAFNEYVHVWFKSADTAKTTVRVFGSVLVSFPANVVPSLTDLNSDIDPLIITLKNTDKIRNILPNNQLVSQVNDAFAAQHTFAFEKTQLAEWLSLRKTEKPDSQFFNVEILKYEVKEPTVPPLFLTAYWKLESQNTDLRIDYRLNKDSSVDCSLLNVIFTTKVEGCVANVIADPKAEWSPSSNTISWKLTELSRDGEGTGSLKARLSLSSGPATASQTFVQFQTSNASVSGIDVQIAGDDLYHLSMVRKKVFSGKYFCDGEIRN